ncbi:MAG: hypothetical protein Q8916_12585 [Bacteroidota bacterium]|nr:hypothetical protein [Bacteroidota bacterium]MDP4231230.1 hypothetical protein [Bacteroidota bacterium]
MNRFLIFIIFIVAAAPALAQKTEMPLAEKYPAAKLSEKEIYTFDIARPVKHFDATPTGDNWFAVDEFGLMQTMIVRGVRFEKRFNEIPVHTARLSPKGDEFIWMGLERSFDSKGFNTTTTTVYKSTMQSVVPDSIGSFTSDYNSLYYSRSGNHWAAVLPAANVYQRGLRDVVLYDGLIIGKDNPKPASFSFGPDELSWAYRSTDARDEFLVTQYAVQKMYTRTNSNPYLPSPDPIIYHFTPDISSIRYTLDGRDYDFGFRHSAQLYKTSYFPSHQDTSHMYLIFGDKRGPNFRWINNIQIDTNGNHVAYFACDTTGEGRVLHRNEKIGVVVEDGKIIAGPYEDMGRLFLSPSGKNIAWSAKKNGTISLYLNGKRVGDVGEYVDFFWSGDEKKFAYLSGDERGKNFLVAGGKRSPAFDRVGRVGWTSDNKAIEYCAVKYDKLLKIRQPF